MLMEILQICVSDQFANFAIRGLRQLCCKTLGALLQEIENAFPWGSSHGKAFCV